MAAKVLLQLCHKIGTMLVLRTDDATSRVARQKLSLERMRLRNLRALEPFESIKVPGGEILVLPFIRERTSLDITSKMEIVTRTKGRTFLFLLDSDAVVPALYKHMTALIGTVDALFIGIECHWAPLTWLYGSLLTAPISRFDRELYRLCGSDCRPAVSVVRELAYYTVFVYAMGQELWLRHIVGAAYGPDSTQLSESTKFIEQCRAEGVQAVRLCGCREIAF